MSQLAKLRPMGITSNYMEIAEQCGHEWHTTDLSTEPADDYVLKMAGAADNPLLYYIGWWDGNEFKSVDGKVLSLKELECWSRATKLTHVFSNWLFQKKVEARQSSNTSDQDS